MLVTPQTLKIGAVVGVMALGTLVGWRMLVAEPGCDLGKRAPQIVTDIKAAHDLSLWKHETCIDHPIDMSPYPNRPTSRECTWDDGQVVLRTHLSEAAMLMSVHLRQRCPQMKRPARSAPSLGSYWSRCKNWMAPSKARSISAQSTMR